MIRVVVLVLSYIIIVRRRQTTFSNTLTDVFAIVPSFYMIEMEVGKFIPIIYVDTVYAYIFTTFTTFKKLSLLLLG